MVVVVTAYHQNGMVVCVFFGTRQACVTLVAAIGTRRECESVVQASMHMGTYMCLRCMLY